MAILLLIGIVAIVGFFPVGFLLNRPTGRRNGDR